MSDKEYSLIDGHKLSYHPEWARKWHAAQGNWELAKTIYPLYVEISPAGQCNHRCAWCAVDYIGYKNRLLNEESLLRVFGEMTRRRNESESWNGVKSVMFAGEGEPTLHPKLAEIVVGAKNAGIDTALTTNGTGMGKKFVDKALAHITWIKVSLDAATDLTHAINHHASKEQFAEASRDFNSRLSIGNELLGKFTGEFDRIISNIQYACEQNKQSGSQCMIGAQLLMNPTNIHETILFAKLMKDIGCDYCVIKPYSQHFYSLNKQDKLFGGFSYRNYAELEREILQMNEPGFNVVFRSRTMENYEDPDRRYSICQSTPMAWGYIMATGEFISCSAYLPQDEGIGDQRFVLGSIKNQSFQELWEGDKRKRNWEFVNNELDIKECRKNCRMDAVNRFLWDEIKDATADELKGKLPKTVIPLRNVNFI